MKTAPRLTLSASVLHLGLLALFLLEIGLGFYVYSHPPSHPCSDFPGCYRVQELSEAGKLHTHTNYWPWDRRDLRAELLHRLFALPGLLLSFGQLLELVRGPSTRLRLELGAAVPILVLTLILSGVFLSQTKWQALSEGLHFANAGALILVQGILTAGGLPSRAS